MIKSLKSREILDSRGESTVEIELRTDKKIFRASVPSGTSRGKYEAKIVEPSKAVENINKIIGPKLIGQDPAKQKEIDELMMKCDGTENKSKLGANAILAVSIAVCRAGAADKNLPLYQHIQEISRGRTSGNIPKPSVLLIEGGLHANNKLDFQEFMAVGDFRQAKKIYQKLGRILGPTMPRGLEGGFAPQISEPEKALDLIMKATKGCKVKIGLDCAASHWKDKKYNVDFYLNLAKKYPIVFLEDPFSQDDWQSWQEITKKLGKKITIIGDDLLTTNAARIGKAGRKKACNGAIIKPNQIGTLTETLQAARLAKSYGWKIMVSHRSGETMDDFIADLAVGIGADFLKSGAPFPPERLAKYNRLLKIEKELK